MIWKKFYLCGKERKMGNYKPKENQQKSRVEEPMAVYAGRSIFNRFSIQDDYKLLKKAREGVKTDVFYSLADAIKMPEKNLATLINLSPRTISNYRDQEKELDPIYSEHLLKLINLYNLGKEIFGSIEEFSLWMNRPFWNSEERPIDFISTSGGVDLIYEEIEKLAQGYPV